MDGNVVSVLCYRTFKPQGKVRRRVQDLRLSSASYIDFTASAHRLDLSHNESARMAVDSLLSQGLEEYHQVLSTEGEVDFLSQLEKIYISENGRDGSSDDPCPSEEQLESCFADSQFGTQCPALSADSDPLAGVDLSCWTGATDSILTQPSFEVYFQSHYGSAGMKDLIREFMRKATETLVIVVDSFTDVELLCDLLEASTKRNVSVHLLLDHLNLNLFVDMWEELKLNSKNFAKLSVRSVEGQTYRAKTGRKLSGQITEAFIIADWTEVLTGSYSFSWLSWQVHRSLAVLVKGSAVLPFHTEFLRLNSNSHTVPGFISSAAMSHASPFPNKTQQAPPNCGGFAGDAESAPSKLSRIEEKKAEARAKVQFLSSLESNRGAEMARPADSGWSQCAQARPKPLPNVSASKAEPAGGAVYVYHGPKRNGEPLYDGRNHIQNHLGPLSPTQISHAELRLGGLAVSAAAQKPFPAQGQRRTIRYQAPNPNLDYRSVPARSLFFQQSEKERAAKTLGTAVHQKKHHWFRSQTPRAKTDLLRPKSPPLSAPERKDLKKDLLPLILSRGPRCGLQGRNDHHPHLQSRPTAQPLASPAARRNPLEAGSQLLSLGEKLNQEAAPRLNWKSQGHAAKPKLSLHRSFLSSLYKPGWRQGHGSSLASLRRSKSLNETPSTFPKRVLLSDVAT